MAPMQINIKAQNANGGADDKWNEILLDHAILMPFVAVHD
jgi:hypothetical protein